MERVNPRRSSQKSSAKSPPRESARSRTRAASRFVDQRHLGAAALCPARRARHLDQAGGGQEQRPPLLGVRRERRAPATGVVGPCERLAQVPAPAHVGGGLVRVAETRSSSSRWGLVVMLGPARGGQLAERVPHVEDHQRREREPLGHRDGDQPALPDAERLAVARGDVRVSDRLATRGVRRGDQVAARLAPFARRSPLAASTSPSAERIAQPRISGEISCRYSTAPPASVRVGASTEATTPK